MSRVTKREALLGGVLIRAAAAVAAFAGPNGIAAGQVVPIPWSDAVRPLDREQDPEISPNSRPHVLTEPPGPVTWQLVPSIPNLQVSGARPHNVATWDPCRLASRVVLDRTLPRVAGSADDAHRWATYQPQPGGGETEVTQFPESAGYHSLLFHYDSPNMSMAKWYIQPSHLYPADRDDSAYRLYGFRSNANPAMPLSTGDFLPAAPTLDSSSLALMPGRLIGQSTGWHGLSRPMLDGQVDLITGVPIIRVTDLELPFGSATFRLTRTRASGPLLPHSDTPHSVTKFHLNPSDAWWDWTGVGWMTGESPLLIIDSAFPDIVGNNPRTTRLVLDAHTSIPFQLIETTGEYEAPPRFRAILRHNGDWNHQLHEWITRPTEYHISLYEGELTYKFVAIWEDVPDNRWYPQYLDSGNGTYDPETQTPTATHSHDRPMLPQQFATVPAPNALRQHNPLHPLTNPGAGIPYFGICIEISDRFGHRAEMTYHDAGRQHMDDPATPDCIECRHDTLRKGQLKYIKLFAAGQSTAAWTLVYSYRKFPGINWIPNWGDHSDYEPSAYDIVTSVSPDADPGRYEVHGDIAIDSIYAYEGDIAASVLDPADLTLPHTSKPIRKSSFVSDARDDAIKIYNDGHPGSHLPTDWKHQVKYHYSSYYDLSDQWTAIWSPPLADPVTMKRYPWYFGVDSSAVTPMPTLVLTSVHTRLPGTSTASVSTSHRAYVYSSYPVTNPHWLGMTGSQLPWLRGILEDRELREAVRVCTNVPATQEGDRIWAWLLAVDRTVISVDRLRPLCTSWFEPASTEPGSWEQLPSLETLRTHGYASFTNDTSAYVQDEPGGVVKKVSVKDPSGRARHYHIRRFINAPDLHIPGGVWPTPQSSAWFVPYSWRGFPASMDEPSAALQTALPDLQQPRFVVVIDEYPDRDALGRVAYVPSFGDSLGVDPSDFDLVLTVSRRMVLINASGYVLKERKWSFQNGGAVVTGSGIGEDFHYESLKNLFEIPSTVPQEVQNEQVLVEHRSLGWSVAEEADLQPGGTEDSRYSSGLVRFFEYGLIGSEDVPWRSRVKMIAEGIQKGSIAGITPPPSPTPTKSYTRQVFFESNDPQQPSMEVVFNTFQSQLLQNQPDYDDQTTDSTFSLTRFQTEFSQGEGEERTVTARTTIRPPRRLRPGGDWYCPMVREEYDDRGQTTWTVTGLVKDPLNPALGDPDASLLFNYTKYDESGRPIAVCVDVELGATLDGPAGSGVQVVLPPLTGTMAGWTRLGAGTNPANYVTVTRYDPLGMVGITDIFYPGPTLGSVGPRYARRWTINCPDAGGNPPYRLPDDYYVDEFIFNNIKPGTGTTFATQSAGEHRVYAGQKPIGTPRECHRGFFDTEFSLELTGKIPVLVDGEITEIQTNESLPSFKPLASVKFTLDSDGRPQQAELIETAFDGSSAAVGSKWVNELVDVRREQEIDGTITRTTRNLIGQHMRTYVGTADSAWQGDKANVNSEGEYLNQANQPGTPENPVHNMVITERIVYGSGVNDARLPVVHRKYRSHNRDWADKFYTTPEEQEEDDEDGYATVTAYDWQRRPVRVDVHDKGIPGPTNRLSTTLTYLDLRGRPYLVATFGADGELDLSSSDLDPAARIGNEVDPVEPEDFYSLPLRPHTIVRTFYGPDGTANVVERYAVPPGPAPATPEFQSEHHYFGIADKEVFTQTPGSPVTINTIDALGRVAKTRTVAPGRSSNAQTPYAYEITRTEYVYDYYGNVLEEQRLERAVEDTTDTLAAGVGGNAVRSRTLSWYDTENRLIATADLGTEMDTLTVGAGSTYAWSASAPTATVTPGSPGSVTRQNTSGLEAARLSFSIFNPITGNLLYTVAPDNSVTEYRYGKGNRLAYKIENAVDLVRRQRATQYGYQWGRLIEMIAWAGIDAESPGLEEDLQQASTVVYGADVVNENFEVVSRNNGLIGAFHLPNKSTAGSYDQLAAIRLRYTFQGQIAERIDPRGVVFRYRYDALDRLASVEVRSQNSSGDSDAGYPALMNTPGPQGQTPYAPADRIGFVQYSYHPRSGRLTRVLALTSAEETAKIISDTTFTYDRHGNLLTETQELGAEASNSSPKITYEWENSPTLTSPAATGRNRLISMTYPAFSTLAARKVELDYGSTGSLDELFSRIASIETLLTPSGTASGVAEFDYMGQSRRRSMLLGGQTLVDMTAAGGGMSGLDGFGRTKDLHYTTGSGGSLRTLYRAQYTYDAAGNRLTARVDRAATAVTAEQNVWSQLNAYNALGQLIDSDFGALDTPGTEITTGTRKHRDEWALDALGNWNSRPNASEPVVPPGRRITDVVGGVATVVGIIDETDNRNRIGERTDSRTSSPAKFRYDSAGNLRSDGTYFYQYDAWNRLVQINLAIPNPNAPSGEPGEAPIELYEEPWFPGTLIKHFKYDGLGRLAEVQSPYPDPTANLGKLRTERFYYDGLRRIQERVIDPVIDSDGAGDSNNPGLMAAAQGEAGAVDEDGDTASLALENFQDTSNMTYTRIEREYIWGPGDRGIDELLVQYDWYRNPWWMLTDDGGDVVAMVSNTGPSGTAAVAAQWTYDAYGAVIAQNVFNVAAPVNRCGHKGLFADRLDVGIVNGSGGPDRLRLEPGAKLVYQVRNRAYSPELGRWLQSDPNATGMALLGESAYHGTANIQSVDQFAAESHFADGFNVFAYLGGNTWTRHDDLGLFVGYDDLAMAFVGGMRGGMDEMVGQYAANMEADLDWASDWAMGDDWHSRLDNKWVNLAFALGFYRGMMEQVRDSFYIEEMSDVVIAAVNPGTGRGAKRGLRAVSDSTRTWNRLKIHETYEAAKLERRADGVVAHSHHLVEKQMDGPWRRGRKGNGPAVNLDPRFHLSDVRKLFNDAYNKFGGPKNLSLVDAKRVVGHVYRNAPRLRNETWKWMDGR